MRVMLLVHNRATTPLRVTFADFAIEESAAENAKTIEDPVERANRQRAAAAATHVNRIAVGTVLTVAGVVGWITSFSHSLKSANCDNARTQFTSKGLAICLTAHCKQARPDMQPKPKSVSCFQSSAVISHLRPSAKVVFTSSKNGVSEVASVTSTEADSRILYETAVGPSSAGWHSCLRVGR